ncbi:MAG TPA: hypothetical protein VJT32_07765 [bacterium]|nr:hypothetical protein [bacterium]
MSLILFEVIATHTIGRIAGPAWVLLCISYYIWHRHQQGYPIWRSLARNWPAKQMAILESAQEFSLLEEYRFALAAKEKTRTKQARK